MAKKIIKDKKDKKEPIDLKTYKYSIESFIEDNVHVRKKMNGGIAFKMWYSFKIKGSFHDKKIMKDWENLFLKFLKEPVK